MQTAIDGHWPKSWVTLVVLLLLPLLLSRCSPSGDSVGGATPPDTPGPQVERQAISNLVPFVIT